MTGHAWPLTQGDSKTRCRKSKVHERHDTHSIRQSGPVRKRAANRRLVPKVTGGQLRLSLTNTYHEWPVINADAEKCPDKERLAAKCLPTFRLPRKREGTGKRRCLPLMTFAATINFSNGSKPHLSFP